LTFESLLDGTHGEADRHDIIEETETP